jgi:sulfur transfer complex TusBCD TusB component (DsrH family)
MMPAVVLLTTRAPSSLEDDLILAEYRVFAALEVSEVLHLCETENVDVIVIGADVEDPDVVEAQMRRITLRLKPEATAKDVVWGVDPAVSAGTARNSLAPAKVCCFRHPTLLRIRPATLHRSGLPTVNRARVHRNGTPVVCLSNVART